MIRFASMRLDNLSRPIDRTHCVFALLDSSLFYKRRVSDPSGPIVGLFASSPRDLEWPSIGWPHVRANLEGAPGGANQQMRVAAATKMRGPSHVDKPTDLSHSDEK